MNIALWCEVGPQLVDIVTNNSREGKLNPRLEYNMVRLDNWQNTCTIGVIGYRIVFITRWSDDSAVFSW